MVYICIYELCFLYCYCICIIYACSSLVEEIKNIITYSQQKLIAALTYEEPEIYKLWSCQKDFDALLYLLVNIFIRFGSKMHRQLGIPKG